MSIHSYLPAERRAAGEQLLSEAEATLCALLARVPQDEDDRAYLRERIAGVKGAVKHHQRYLKIGCPRIPGTD